MPPDFEALRKTRAFKRLVKLFKEVSGLALRMIPPGHTACDPARGQGATCFCKHLHELEGGDSHCRMVLGTLSKRSRAKWGMHSMKCPAGFFESAVPVVVDEKHIATLVLGGARESVNEKEKLPFTVMRLARELSQESLKALMRAYLETPTMHKSKFHSLLELLALHAAEFGRTASEEVLKRSPRRA